MAREEDTGKTEAEHVDRVWALADKIKFALFTTWTGTEQAQWPLSASVERDEDAIYFLVGHKGGKYDHLDRFPAVTLGFADTGGAKYVVINGHAEISNDRDKIHALWSPFAKAWWDSEKDPDIRLLTVRPDKAEIWDSPGQLISSVIMLTAAVTGGKPKTGDHAKVGL